MTPTARVATDFPRCLAIRRSSCRPWAAELGLATARLTCVRVRRPSRRYLAYVGYYCAACGVGQATGLALGAPPTWIHLFTGPASVWPKVGATVIASVVISVALKVYRSPAALPSCMLAIPLAWFVFVAVLCAATQTTWQDMQHALAKHQWIAAPVQGSATQSLREVTPRL